MPYPKVLNDPADYERIGVTPGIVEPWEDGRRSDPGKPIQENWYFDAAMDDGTKLVVSFRPNAPGGSDLGVGDAGDGLDRPNINIHVTTADGHTTTDMIFSDPADSWTKVGQCDLKYGPHYLRGDLVDYDIHVEPAGGVGADLHFHSLVKPFRPGTGYIAFEPGESLDRTWTWTTIPRGQVTGTVTANGRTWPVSGLGYHDHGWNGMNPMAAWHHWLWARQSSGDLTVAMSDLVAAQRYGFTWVPIIGVLDASGEVIFSNIDSENATIDIEERYVEPETGKEYPKKITYTFANDGTLVTYRIEWTEQIEVRAAGNILIKANPELKAKFDALGVNPSYLRYAGKGDITLTDLATGTEQRSVGDMIYEYASFGNPDPRARA